MNRIALTGASGTGKSTLATNLAAHLKLPLNPVGSRSVAESMGFASPYDVDKAGMRGEFQRNLILQTIGWEFRHDEFVTDRTLLDNLAYTALHDVASVSEELLFSCFSGMSRYTHIIHCPVDVFCNPGGDPQRVQEIAYHQVFDAVLTGLFDRWFQRSQWGGKLVRMEMEGREERIESVKQMFNVEER